MVLPTETSYLGVSEPESAIQIMSCNAIKYALYNVRSQLDTRVGLIMVSSCSVEENSSQEDVTTEAADIVAQMAFKVYHVQKDRVL